MEIKLTDEESIKLFYNSLCNGLGHFSGYGLMFQYDNNEYRESRSKLTEPCWEDVLIQMIRDGYKLTMKDIEGDGEYTRSITLKDIIERVPKSQARSLINIHNKEADMWDYDHVLQIVFFEDIIFG